jgi:hypothetical protein
VFLPEGHKLMADYSTASQNAADALVDSADGLVEEYEIRTNGRRVKRGRLQDQIQAAALLEGLAARRAGRAICNLAKPKNAQ